MENPFQSEDIIVAEIDFSSDSLEGSCNLDSEAAQGNKELIFNQVSMSTDI